MSEHATDGEMAAIARREYQIRLSKPITPQKVRAVLRKAGHSIAKWHRSRMIRGWGEWTPGYRVDVKPASTTITVTYPYHHIGSETGRADRIAKAFVVLEPLGGKLAADGESVTFEISPVPPTP